MNFLNNLPFNWFDVLLVAVLFVGILRGRKRGMSLEVFTMLQWVFTIFVCGVCYEPAGNFLASVAQFTSLTSYVLSYITLVILVSLMFMMIKKGTTSSKIVGTDSFGRGEYYLGMPAGMIRFGCILIAILAVLNARYYTTKEIKDREAYQKDMYGSEFFPGLSSLQTDVFEKSFAGPNIRKYMSFFLIKPTPPDVKEVKQHASASMP